jgi:putative YpdA family bacillithiol system oxidoreductase
MESLYTLTIFLVLTGVVAVPYWVRAARKRRETETAFRRSKDAGSLMPVTLHPRIELSSCIGCGSCVQVCPESVLGIVEGHAAVVNGMHCVGHALCAEVCPVGAITMQFGTPKEGQEIPFYDDRFETNVPNLFIVGELGGVGLIRNAVTQARIAVAHYASKKSRRPANGLDMVIVGAGPAGLTAALACEEARLSYTVLEQDSVGGTIFHYPRRKLVLTAPVEIPLHGMLKASEMSKEQLLEFWGGVIAKHGLKIQSGVKVDGLERTADAFAVKAGEQRWSSGAVVLAQGRRGSPRKLGVPGEELPKVVYRLLDAEAYIGQKLLIVGGGDSAIEAAVGLSRQKGNVVTLSYRRNEFVRIKERNQKNVDDAVKRKSLTLMMGSNVSSISEKTVKIVDAAGAEQSLPNDHVFVFAGGEAPTELLKKAGVRLRS